MIKKMIAWGLIFTILLLTACDPGPKTEYSKYTDSFFDTFDTITMVVAYTKSQEEFQLYFEKIHDRFLQLHRLYDKYQSYEGINNIKTINDMAGIEPVKVEKEVIDLILFSKEWYEKTSGAANIAFGPVLEIWHDYRTEGMDDPQGAQLPPIELLEEAAEFTDLSQVIVNIEESTVFLPNPKMSLDVGAVAKGYATELVAREIMAMGMESGIISAGGNIRTIGKPLDGLRSRWGVGIQDPDSSIVSENQNLEVVFVNDASVVSSGDYQRYYKVGDELFHHLIDPTTLMPARHYRAVTVIAQDSGIADFLSTALFLMPPKEAQALAEALEGVEALWVMPDGEIEITKGMEKIMKSKGASDR